MKLNMASGATIKSAVRITVHRSRMTSLPASDHVEREVSAADTLDTASGENHSRL